MPLELFTSETAIATCACGSEHLAIVSTNGDVYTWGRKGGRRLGLPEDRLSEKVEVPTKVTSLSGIRIRDVACGNFQTVCLTERGQVVSWGKDNGKLTCAEPIETGIPYMSALPWKPCYIRMPAVKVAKVHCGFEFSIALTECAKLYGWGENNKGQLGFRSSAAVTRPTVIHIDQMNEFEDDSEYITSVACGANHVCAIDNEGRLYSWGDNEFGQSGQGHWDPIALPKLICGTIEGLKVHSVSCGQHTIAIAGPRKRLFSWGAGTRGQLGLGTEVDVNTPKQIPSVNDLQFDKIYCGEYHSLGIASGSLVYTWGSNLFGELTQGKKGSLRKVACYTEPHYRGKNLQEVLPGKAEALSVDTTSDCFVKFECGGVNTLIVKYRKEEGLPSKTPRRLQTPEPKIQRRVKSPNHMQFLMTEKQVHESNSEAQRVSPKPVLMEEKTASNRLFAPAIERNTVFKASPEAVFFPVPPKEQCKSMLVLREIKKRRHRKALQSYRKAKTDVIKKGSPEKEIIQATRFAGNSLETIFNDIIVTPSERENFPLQNSDRDSVIKSVENAADHLQRASISIADASAALGETEKEEEDNLITGRGQMSHLERNEIVQVSQEIKKYIERYHGKLVDMPSTPRKGEDLDIYYEEVAYHAHTAASRILKQMKGMRLMYEDLNQAVSSLESDNPDAYLIEKILSHHGLQ